MCDEVPLHATMAKGVPHQKRRFQVPLWKKEDSLKVNLVLLSITFDMCVVVNNTYKTDTTNYNNLQINERLYIMIH